MGEVTHFSHDEAQRLQDSVNNFPYVWNAVSRTFQQSPNALVSTLGPSQGHGDLAVERWSLLVISCFASQGEGAY